MKTKMDNLVLLATLALCACAGAVLCNPVEPAAEQYVEALKRLIAQTANQDIAVNFTLTNSKRLDASPAFQQPDHALLRQIGPAQRHLFSRKGDKTCYRIQNHQGGAFVESSCMWKLGDRTYVYTPGNGPDDESQCILAPHALDVLETGDQMLAAMANERAELADQLEDSRYRHVKVSGTIRGQPFSVYVTLDPAAPSPVQEFTLNPTPGMQMEVTDVSVDLQTPVDDSVFELPEECRELD